MSAPVKQRRRPRGGDVLRLTRAASVQFVEPILFRVIRVQDWPTTEGWVWLDGYQLDAAGLAVERRSLYVQLCGLQDGYAGRSAPQQPRRQVAAR